ncbi:MAG TPA: ATP-binding protein [Spirochaetota bacterium]|nr:ATP-binding protein [Spirochaetota bacterium]HPR39125.1 ATP-binding protein [Spirochaetota bacterium]
MNTRKEERIENELRYLKRRVSYLESFITCHPDLAFLIDENGRYVDILTSCEGQLYKSARELIGKRLVDELPEKTGIEAAEIIHKTLSTGESQVYEYMLDVPDGRHWFEGRTSLLLTEDGSRYVIWVARNITSRKTIEKELLKQKAVVLTAIESLPFEFWVFDKNRECILQNSRAMSILGNCAGKNLFDLPVKRKRLELVDNEIEAILSGSNLQIEVSRKNRNEEEFFLLIGAPVIVEGDAVGATGIKIDVTKQKKYENTLSRMQRIESLGLLAGGIAHDFNNLLMGVMGNISLAMLSGEPGSGRNEHLAESVKLIEEAKRLTSQLLTFARGGAPKRKSVLLQEHIPQWVRFASSGTSADLKISISSDTPPVSIDTDQFSQVINNLIINALQAGGSEVRIGIDARRETADTGSDVILAVTDNGPGIPDDIIDKIFDPYYSTKPGGTGLGLTICHSIISQHGGEISVCAKPGKETSFIIRLPSTEEKPEHISSHKEHQIIRGSGNILVLDDDDSIGRLLERFLKKTGYTPVIAKNSMEAVSEFGKMAERGEKFSAVLLDLTIPGDCGGVECLRLLKNLEPSIKAIVMSGYAENRALADYRELGFAGSLEKPFTLESLSSILASIINLN